MTRNNNNNNVKVQLLLVLLSSITLFPKHTMYILAFTPPPPPLLLQRLLPPQIIQQPTTTTPTKIHSNLLPLHGIHLSYNNNRKRRYPTYIYKNAIQKNQNNKHFHLDDDSSSNSNSISSNKSSSNTSSSCSELSVLPNDNQFYDGYEEFIKNLQQDLENDSFDIYDNDDVVFIEEDKETTSTRIQQQQNQSNNYKNNKNKKNKYNRRNKKLPHYKRDMNDDMSIQVDTSTITKLIIQRSKAQKDRNFDKADSILDELNNIHGVYVWDKDRLWSVSPIAPSRRYSGSSSRSGGGGQRMDNLNRNNYFDNDNKRFGRNGHDYIQIGNGINTDVCKLELNEIHSLLGQRLGYKLLKQYKKADEIQSQLYQNGVRVHDKMKQWRADGGIFADIEGMLSNKEYTMNEFSDVIEDESVLKDIESHIQKWVTARKQSNYHEADRLRQFLWDTFKVAVDDKSRTWSYGGDFGPDGTFRWTDEGPINPRRNKNIAMKDWRKVGMYSKSIHSEALNNKDDEEEVWNLIHDRLEARRVKDFDVADLIRDHLYKVYRVSVDDQLRQWSVGGLFEHNATSAVRSASPTTSDGNIGSSFVRVYNQRGGNGHLSDKEVLLVKALIERRAEETARYNLKAAESIRIGLKKKFYVIVDDMNGEWHVRGNDFILSNGVNPIPETISASMIEIEALIRERSQARGEGDFQRADEIRSDLFECYGVILDDRLKEWSIVDYEGKE